MEAIELRKQFADENKICMSDCKFIPETDPQTYIDWLEHKLAESTPVSEEPLKLFLVTYRYKADKSPSSPREHKVYAKNCVEACNRVVAHYNDEVKWHTVKEIEPPPPNVSENRIKELAYEWSGKVAFGAKRTQAKEDYIVGFKAAITELLKR